MKAFAALILLLLGSMLNAQTHTNHWINYSQKYLKVPVTEEGVYRIPYNVLRAQLLQMGENLDVMNPKNFQVFHLGDEQYIYIQGEGDNSFDASDFIEFYGNKNDGKFDQSLYPEIDDHTNPYYSLANDTAWYFITWNNSQTNRRMQVDNSNNYNDFTPVPFILKEKVLSFSNYYAQGPLDINGKPNSNYGRGEGWADVTYSNGGSRTYNVNTVGAVQLASAPDINFRFYLNSYSSPGHRTEVRFGNQVILDTNYSGHRTITKNYTLSKSFISSNSTAIRFSSLPLPSPSASDIQGISYLKVTYASTANFENQSSFRFKTVANNSKSYINAANFNGNSANFVYDLSDHNRVLLSSSGGNLQSLIPAGGEKEIYIPGASSIKNVSNLQSAGINGNFRNIGNDLGQQMLVIITHSSLLNSAGSYASYKSSFAGGNHSVLIVNIADLYEQFSYGIQKHPLSIKEFLRFAANDKPGSVQHVFLLGKSILSHISRKNALNYNNNLLPTFGNPGSDILFAEGLGGLEREISFGVGRLAVNSEASVAAYLKKVQEFEAQKSLPYTLENKLWMKQVLHFAGGSNVNEQRALENYLFAYESILRDTSKKFGANINLFSKSSTNPIQSAISSKITEMINGGTVLLNFFGHASTGGFDISIDNVSSYSNQGKYPLLIANSCFVGDLHQPFSGSPNTSEEFVLTPGKGSIGFLASSSLGYPPQLHTYTTKFIDLLSTDLYGESIGRIMKETANSVGNLGGNISNVMRNTINEMSLHGDPSLSLYSHQKSEIILKEENAFFSPQAVSSDLDSFRLHVVLYNVGKNTSSQFKITCKRTFANGSDTLNEKTIGPLGFSDTIEFVFPVDIARGVGVNNFEIIADPAPFSIDEYDNVSNNSIKLQLLIISEELVPALPEKYGITNKSNFTLTAITANLSANERDYIFQIDKNPDFNSSKLKQHIVRSKGGVISWKPEFSNEPDSSIFYWRTAPYNSDTLISDLKWRESSFRVISTTKGWSQAQFAQFSGNSNQSVIRDENSQIWQFVPSTKTFSARIVGNPPPIQTEYNKHETRLDGELLDFSICWAQPSIYVTVLDSASLEPWRTQYIDNSTNPPTILNPNNDFGNTNNLNNCRQEPEPRFMFRLGIASEEAGLFDMLQNKIPDGNYILLHTVMRGNFQNSSIWTPQRQSILTQLGATSIPTLSDSVPYIFFVKKGDLSTAQEVIGTSNFGILDFTTILQNNASFGIMQSEKIGPVRSWEKASFRATTDAGNADVVRFDLIGVRSNGEEQLIESYEGNSGDFQLSNSLSASDYPYVYFKMTTKDEVQRTPAQLKSWMVFYEPLPDYSISPNDVFEFRSDSVAQGANIFVKIASKNISDLAGENIKIRRSIIGSNRQINAIEGIEEILLNPNELFVDSFQINTRNLEGVNTFLYEINPAGSDYKPELYAFNNLFYKTFHVENDNLNPLLDVNFDGVRILDGDIVSANPHISIILKDENKFLALNDTAFFDVWLVDPDKIRKRIPFVHQGTEILQFTPGNLSDNRAQVDYKPQFKKDGIYQLTVSAKDASGNVSGSNDYKIGFEVVTRSTITQVLNYPNPFTTSTRFVFTLTGSEIPDYMRIQIMTISGKVVREIDLPELGPINIGRNITQFAWDGTDQFGDRLANGVYLYRVQARINGKAIELRSSNADGYFHKEFGKMYLFR